MGSIHRYTRDNRVGDAASRWLILCLLLCWSLGVGAAEYTIQTIPNVQLQNRNQYVSNPDGILRQDVVEAINQQLAQLRDSLGIEVAVVAVESIGDNDPRMFANELFKLWGIGKREDDNGLLIQLITAPQQRSVVFETGYGLEGVLPDAICYRLQQTYMVPDMKSGDFSLGMLRGVVAVKDYLMASDYERSLIAGEEGDGEPPWWFFLLIMFGMPLFILAVALLAYYQKRRPRICPNCGQKSYQYVGRETLRKPTYKAEGLAVETYRCKNCGHTDRKNHRISRLQESAGPVIIGGGSRGGGFGGGGFGGGGFGGGRSGGGGSISRF